MGSSQVNLGCREVRYCSFTKNLYSNIPSSLKNSRLCIKLPEKSFTLKASACEQAQPLIKKNNRKPKPVSYHIFLFIIYLFPFLWLEFEVHKEYACSLVSFPLEFGAFYL